MASSLPAAVPPCIDETSATSATHFQVATCVVLCTSGHDACQILHPIQYRTMTASGGQLLAQQEFGNTTLAGTNAFQ